MYYAIDSAEGKEIPFWLKLCAVHILFGVSSGKHFSLGFRSDSENGDIRNDNVNHGEIAIRIY